MGIKQKLFEIRQKVGKLTKDTANPFYKSKYADINQLIELTDPLFFEQNILCTMPIKSGYVVIELDDLDSGETITSELKLPESNDPQKVGSAITYFRRYALKSLLNIQEEDDDANKASGNIQEEDKKENPWLTEEQFNAALARIKKGEKDVVKNVLLLFRLKKVYRETLESAEKNYKPKT